MAKVTIVVKGGKEGAQGIYRKGDIRYAVRETEKKWKLVSLDLSIKVEMEWSKTDFPTLEEWQQYLVDEGYIKE